jgi:hypothetical protein
MHIVVVSELCVLQDERREVLCDLRAPSMRIGVVERDVEIVVSVGLSVLPPPTQGPRARPGDGWCPR